MAENYQRTDIHLVSDLQDALTVAHNLGAQAIELDLEGVIGNYVGNNPYEGYFRDFTQGEGDNNLLLAGEDILSHQDTAYGIATNNSNQTGARGEEGIVTRVADILHIPFVHKGMRVGEAALRGKPSGDQSTYLCKMMGVNPEDAVLIDDQGVKNAGEAVKAGLKAIIVPKPIGLPRGKDGAVEEHTWVRRARVVEPSIYRSLGRQGLIAKVAYSRLAGIDSASIGLLYNHRAEV